MKIYSRFFIRLLVMSTFTVVALEAEGYDGGKAGTTGISLLTTVDRDAEFNVDPPTPRSEEGRRVLHQLNGLASIGSAAWPTVRAYVWASSFNGHGVFLGYAHSMPGKENGEVMTFQLMVDKNHWSAMDANDRQKLMYEVNESFDSRLAELNLRGNLELVLITR